MDGLDFDASGCESFATIDAEQQARITAKVKHLVWSLTARRFGLETVTVRPVQPQVLTPTNVPTRSFGLVPWLPYVTPFALGPATDPYAVIKLAGPIDSVVTVKVDGVTLAAGDYTVQQRNQLVRLGGGRWPQSQNLALPDTQPGTFSVRYVRGEPLTEAGQAAAVALACELAKAVAGGECSLPQKVKQVTREGIQVDFLDTRDFLENGRTGVVDFDQWVQSVNPDNLQEQAYAWSPDLPMNVRQS